MTLGGCCMSIVLWQFARNCLHCCKPFHSYTSHLEMLRHMVCTPFWLVLMGYQAVISYQKFSVPLLSLFMQKKIADFSKLPFMLKSTLDYLNSIRESGSCWCVYCSWDSHIKLRGWACNNNQRQLGTNCTEITSFVSSTVSSARGYSLIHWKQILTAASQVR